MIIFLKDNWILMAIIIIAFTLRVVGIFYGYPLLLVADESPTLLATLKMIGSHSLRVASPGYYYPALMSYVYLPFISIFLLFGKIMGYFPDIKSMQETVLLNLGVFLPVTRIISVLFGTLTVFLVYKISEKLFDRHTALLAAWLLAISYFHVSNSHFAQTWTIQTFFVALAFYYAVKFLQKKESMRRDYIIGGVLCGLAFGINLVGIVAYYWFLLAHIIKNKGREFIQIFIKNDKFWLMNFVLLLTVSAVYYLNPYGLNNYFARIIDTKAPAVVGGGGYSSYKLFSFSFLQIFCFYVINTLIQEPALFVLSILGSVYLYGKRRDVFYILSPLVPIYFFLISPLTGAMGRYILPVIPLLAILSAQSVVLTYKKNLINKNILILLVVVISGYSLVLDIVADQRMLKADTRILARQWIINNIPSASKIKNDDLGVSLSLVENKDTIEMIKKKLPDLFSSARRYLSDLSDEKYPKPNFFIIPKGDLTTKSDYIILGNFEYDVITKMRASVPEGSVLVAKFYPEDDNYAMTYPGRIESDFTPDNSRFKPWKLFIFSFKYNGPYIEIYKQ